MLVLDESPEFPRWWFDHRFQIASLYCKAPPWKAREMAEVMLDVARTSLKLLDGALAF
jgi:type II restriction enzyme